MEQEEPFSMEQAEFPLVQRTNIIILTYGRSRILIGAWNKQNPAIYSWNNQNFDFSLEQIEFWLSMNILILPWNKQREFWFIHGKYRILFYPWIKKIDGRQRIVILSWEEIASIFSPELVRILISWKLQIFLLITLLKIQLGVN